MCRNLARKSGTPVFGFDRADEPLQRLADAGVKRARVAGRTSPSSATSSSWRCRAASMCRPCARAMTGCSRMPMRATPIVDLGTSPVEASRELAKRFAAKGASLCRCADRAHATGGGRRHAQRHGRRRCAADVQQAAAADRDLRHRHHPLRRESAQARWSRSSTTWC